MRLEQAVNIDDLRRLAKRRLPGFLYDMIEGGVDDELGVARNEAAFRARLLFPRVLNDVRAPDQSTTLLGRRYASPFGISATGPAPLFRVGADAMLAEAAVQSDIPFILSGTSGASLEEIARIAPGHAWYQLYPAKDAGISADMVRRAADAGLPVLVLTVDTPVTPKRERHLRNRISSPLRLNADTLLRVLREGITHPAWSIDYLRNGGMPMLGTWARYAPPGSTPVQVSEFYRAQTPYNQTWADLETFRRLWPGKLVVKGIMHPEDAKRAVDLGADAIIVSNHGGKAIDRAPATLDILPLVAAAVGDRAEVMLDGGIRRGSDIVVARCVGARYVFSGRPTLYGVAAGGRRGADRAIEILRSETNLVLAALGCPSFDGLGPEFLFPHQPAATGRVS